MITLDNLDKTKVEKALNPKVWTNRWKVIELDDIKGRLNVMWLTPGGKGIATHTLSHMTILNMIVDNYYKPDEMPFWHIGDIREQNVDDPVILNPHQDSDPKANKMLAKYMAIFMRVSGFVRMSGPYRDKKMGGLAYGHASKLLEHRDFVYEYFGEMTTEQEQFVDKIIDIYNLEETEIQVLKYD